MSRVNNNDDDSDSKEKEGGVFVIEKVDISDESEPESLQEELSDEDQRVEEDDINNLEKLISTITKKDEQEFKPSNEEKKVGAKTVKRLEVVDDFIRNFMIKHKMTRSLEVFQQEWYELSQKGKIASSTLEQVPDVYIKNEKLEEQIDYLKSELDKARLVAERAKSTWDKLRKERDFHKMHHHRVQQEKKKLNLDIEKLKNLHKQYEVKYLELSSKYEAAMKEKMLLKLERDRLITKSEALQKSLNNIEEKMVKDANEQLPKIDSKVSEKEKDTKKESKSKKPGKLTPFPPDDRLNPMSSYQVESQNYKNSVLNKTYKGHMMAISALSMHPRKSIVATASDDYTWKIWTLPAGELIMSGEGHKDWLSGVHFHPRGSHLVTSSGDCTIKVWDFINASCMHTFKEHIQPVWSVAYNDTGEFIVTGSMDHTSKLIDLNAQKNRYTFRGHVDSVNHVTFQPYSNIFASSSADKTISLWDMRTGLCIQTFYGHLNCVNNAQFSYKGDLIASCDSDGIVKVWDIRMVKEKNQYDAGPYSANSVYFDKSGTYVAAASDEGTVKIFNDSTAKLENTLKGHEDAVQDVAFDYNSKMIITCSSDCTFRVWQ